MDNDLTTSLIHHQREAEWLFAACAMINGEYVAKECGYLSPDTILDIGVRDFWTRILTGEETSRAAIDAGIFHKLAGRMMDVPNYLHAASFASVINDDDYLRRISDATSKMVGTISERDVDKVINQIREMANNVPSQPKSHPTSDNAHLEFVEGLYGENGVIMTGISNLDRAIGGLERKTLSIAAARPSMGKTSLFYQIGENMAHAGKKVVFFSIEMTKRQLWAKRACGNTGIDYRQYKTKSLTDEQREELTEESERLRRMYGDNLIIHDEPIQTEKTIWQTVADVKPDAAIVDHLGIVRSDEPNRVHALGGLTLAGKAIAKQFDCSFTYLMQLNRGVEKRDNKRPELSDLRDSGEIEENADAVMFIYREDYYEPPSPGQEISETELIIAKNRDGTRNMRVNLAFNLKKQLFFPMDKRQ